MRSKPWQSILIESRIDSNYNLDSNLFFLESRLETIVFAFSVDCHECYASLAKQGEAAVSLVMTKWLDSETNLESLPLWVGAGLLVHSKNLDSNFISKH